MELSIVKEKDNPFLKRKEISLVINHPKAPTPTKAEIIKTVAGSNSVEESQVVIDYIFTKKGISESLIKLKILKEKPRIEIKAKEGEHVEAQTSKAA
ncbi:MAG: hypothetical protein HY361_00365 [Candidatus Aenigmarchaeota archaeon]|nr:hypothetical protein [Candidatus Aenigmarchaeota archaeon]